MVDVHIFKDHRRLAEAVAKAFIEVGRQSIQKRGWFSTVLAGGSTPKAVYQLLGGCLKGDLDWSKVFFFWGDERCVPADDPESNYRMAFESLLQFIPVPITNVFRMEGELEPKIAARNYQKALQSFLDGKERFDFVLLGMGEDGHTASLFPGTDAIMEKDDWVKAVYVKKLDAWRMTLTPPILNRSQQVVFMISGKSKAPALKDVLEGAYQPKEYPAQIIQPKDGRLTWMIDRAAATMLSSDYS